jgi:CRP-like cAMP-binding protein
VSLDTEVEALKKVPLFRGVDDAKLRLLAFISERMSFRPGEHLCEQGERGDVAYIILDGTADIQISTNHGQETVATVKQNDVVGEISILIDVPRTASVVATTEMKVLAIAKDNFLKLLKNFPDMAIEVMRVLAHRLERTTREVGRLRAGSAKAEQ